MNCPQYIRRMERANPRRQPVDEAITEDLIHAVVHSFYARIRDDEILAPIFARVIGENWDAHLAKMCDFWSSVMRMTGRYKGNPMIGHTRLKSVRPEHFDRWLGLFRETVTGICDPKLAELFMMRAENIARSLQLGMFYRPVFRVSGV